MPVIKIHSLCPFRSPVFPPKDDQIISADANGEPIPQQPGQILGPCLYTGCGLFKVTKVDENGKVLDGMCGYRFVGEVLGSIALSLESITKLLVTKEAKTASIFGGSNLPG